MCVMYFECMQIWLETRTPIAGSWRVDNSNYQTISSISPPPPPPRSLHHPIPPFSLSWPSVLLIVGLQTISFIPNTRRVVVSGNLRIWNQSLRDISFFLLRKFHSFCILLQISCYWILYTNTSCVDLMERVRMIWNYCQLVLAPRGVTSELPF